MARVRYNRGAWELQRERFRIERTSPPSPENVVPIGDVVRAVLTESGLAQQWQQREILEAWPELVGEPIARQATPRQLRSGVLIVEVSHPAWLSELERYHKQVILERLRARFPSHKIRALRFQISSGSGPSVP